MTSAHVIRATVHAAQDIPLGVIDAQVRADDSWSPYLQAQLRCWAPPEAELEQIDPRDNSRVTIELEEVTRTWVTWAPAPGAWPAASNFMRDPRVEFLHQGHGNDQWDAHNATLAREAGWGDFDHCARATITEPHSRAGINTKSSVIAMVNPSYHTDPHLYVTFQLRVPQQSTVEVWAAPYSGGYDIGGEEVLLISGDYAPGTHEVTLERPWPHNPDWNTPGAKPPNCLYICLPQGQVGDALDVTGLRVSLSSGGTPIPGYFDYLKPSDPERGYTYENYPVFEGNGWETHAFVNVPTRQREATTRHLDLLLRARTVDHTDGTMEITAETDEALLIDVANVSNRANDAALDHMASLRAIINNVVLSRIGVTLAPGIADFDFTRKAEAVNIVPNSGCAGTLGARPTGMLTSGNAIAACSTDWASSGNQSVRLSGKAGGNNDSTLYVLGGPGNGLRGMVPGFTYRAKCHVHMPAALTGTLNVLALQWSVSWKIGTTNHWAAVVGDRVPNVAGDHVMDVKFTVPEDATDVWLRVHCGAGPGGGAIYVDDITLVQGDYTGPPFSGQTVSARWMGTANNSSQRYYGETALLWEPGVPAWDYLEPLLQTAGLRLFCDEARAWHLVDADYRMPGELRAADGANVTDAQDSISRYKEWFDSVVIEYRWTDASGDTRTAWDSAGAPGSKTLHLRYERPYPGPGGAQVLLQRSEGRGRVLDVSTLSNYAASPGHAFRAELPKSPIQTGYVSSIEWTFPEGTMRIGSKQLTETPPDSWLALPATETWHDSPAGQSWLAETV